jgi:hypothetical protein
MTGNAEAIGNAIVSAPSIGNKIAPLNRHLLLSRVVLAAPHRVLF